MSRFAIREQVECISKFRYAVDMDGYGALQFFTEEKLVVHAQRLMAS